MKRKSLCSRLVNPERVVFWRSGAYTLWICSVAVVRRGMGFRYYHFQLVLEVTSNEVITIMTGYHLLAVLSTLEGGRLAGIASQVLSQGYGSSFFLG